MEDTATNAGTIIGFLLIVGTIIGAFFLGKKMKGDEVKRQQSKDSQKK